MSEPRLPRYSAYVPCYNNAATVRRAVDSVLAQTAPPIEVLVIDDESTDGSRDQLRDLPVRIVGHERNLGRGAARSRAMQEANEEFVLSCDANLALEPSFAATALRWFAEQKVAAVFGILRGGGARTMAERWSERHLFKVDVPRAVIRDARLATGGSVLRKSAVAAVGGFDERLPHSEDAELGGRLLDRGYAVVCEPEAKFVSHARNTVGQVLERYWRWHAGVDERSSWRGYGKTIAYAIKVMAAADLRAGDAPAAAISLACPHYQFWRSRTRTWRRHLTTS